MYYIITGSGIQKIEEKNFWDSNNGLCIAKFPEWNESPELREKSGIWHKTGIMYSCRLELHLDYIFGTFKVPSKIKGGRDITFAIYITNQRIIILDDDGEAKDAASKIAAGPLRKNYSPGRFIYDFLMLFIDEDLLFLEKLKGILR